MHCRGWTRRGPSSQECPGPPQPRTPQGRRTGPEQRARRPHPGGSKADTVRGAPERAVDGQGRGGR
eukprot:830188-Alexandrium_andersonii.AAC.1